MNKKNNSNRIVIWVFVGVMIFYFIMSTIPSIIFFVASTAVMSNSDNATIIVNGSVVSGEKETQTVQQDGSDKDNSKPGNQETNQTQFDMFDHYLQSYHIDVVVNEDNTYEITESINAYFNQPRHGIYRSIPVRSVIFRDDGSKTSVKAKITNIEVDDLFTILKEGKNQVIKIGNPNLTVTGFKKYKIKYKYDAGSDKLKDNDEFYLDLVGTEWTAPIDNISFSIHMPKDFDKEKVGFSTGKKGSSGYSDIEYKVVENTIIGNYTNIVDPGEGISIRIELPEGYYDREATMVERLEDMPLLIPTILLVITFVMWIVWGKDEKVVETVEFYPPEGLSSAEVGMYYKGKADATDVVSLLVSLANKGYLKICDTGDSFKLIRLKDSYEDVNFYEKTFIEDLFHMYKGVVPRDEVTKSDLEKSFYKTKNYIVDKLNENKKKLFVKNTVIRQIIIALMCVGVYYFVGIKPLYEYSGTEEAVLGTLFPVIGAIVGISLFRQKDIFLKVFGLLWGIPFGGIPFFITVVPAVVNLGLLKELLVGVAIIIAMIVILIYMPKRTQYGAQILGKLKGFKHFLETTEKSKLEELVMDNPEYFYNILPYTYVFGISDKWISKFEGIITTSPDWYSGSESFSISRFSDSMSKTMSSATSAISSSPSSGSGGSGSSGGSSSGGGHGGGGGGSW